MTGCSPHSDYTGEPCIHLEYTIGDTHYVYEDWGTIEPRLFGSAYVPESGGPGLYMELLTENQSVACIDLYNLYMSLHLESTRTYFIDGKKYEYHPADADEMNCLYKPEPMKVTDGWFSITKKTAEPYCRYDIRFEFKCQNGQQQVFDVTDGYIQVGRRFQSSDVRSMIKSEAEL